MRREAGQMSRWYEGIREESSNIIYSRIRLARNWDEYVFPSRLSEQAASQVTEQLREGLKDWRASPFVE